MSRLNFRVNFPTYGDPVPERDPVSNWLRAFSILVLVAGAATVGVMLNDSNALAYLRTFAIRW